MKLVGKAHRFGDDINTDLIISGKYKFKTLDMEELSKHLLEDLDPDFFKKIKKGDFIVAGKNFGCGSSREQAPLVIKYAHISAVLASSFARIFYRNAINVGLPLVECDTSKIDEGDNLVVDLEGGKVIDQTKQEEIDITPLPSFMIEILSAGGLVGYIKENRGWRI
ncbi:TPA: 3-isopropylmalate dehydratase [bacterium]|nr:3-isopropylmalate dehydratase [bacterium]